MKYKEFRMSHSGNIEKADVNAKPLYGNTDKMEVVAVQILREGKEKDRKYKVFLKE